MGSQTSSTNKQFASQVSTTKETLHDENKTNQDTSLQKHVDAEKLELENNEKHKKSHSILQRSISTISTKLLSGTLPRLSSSNSLMEQVSQLSKSSTLRQEKIKTDDPYGEVARGLESCYKKVLLPFEEKCKFHHFHYAKYDDCEFEAKPFVLLIGIV